VDVPHPKRRQHADNPGKPGEAENATQEETDQRKSER
jgi:hypothetical protein